MPIKILNLLIPLAIAVLAIFSLAKDWDAHKKYWRRLIVLLLIIIMGVGGAINNYYTDEKTGTLRQQDQNQITALKYAIETANKSQQDNTDKFLTAFSKMSGEVNDLKTEASTEKFRRKVDQLQTELESTQKALSPPKASLTFSFDKPDFDGTGSDILRKITLPVKDNIVHVDFVMINPNYVNAVSAEVAVYICRECEFSSEPVGFIKVPSRSSETQRDRSFPQIFGKSRTPTLSMDIKVPSNASAIEFGVLYRCANCDIAERQVGVITLSR